MSKRRQARIAALAALIVMGATVAPSASAYAPNDPRWQYQNSLRVAGVPEAWNRSTGSGIVLAMIALAGVDRQHEDLRNQLVPGYDFLNPGAEPPPGGHDTAAAGVAVAERNNGVGIAGVAPGARLMPIRIGPGWHDSLRLAVDRGAKVIFYEVEDILWPDDFVGLTSHPIPYEKAMEEALTYAWSRGAVVIGAAGNEGRPYCSNPSAYDRVLCVGATDDEFPDQRALRSNWGFGLDLAAHSRHQATDWNSGEPDNHSAYGPFNGTSGAAAFAAGVAALLMGAGASNEEVVRVLQCTADDLGPEGPDLIYGHGRIHAGRAMAALGSGITCPSPPATVLDLVRGNRP
ncbi:MAG TPA: S8 family serine peptidase [Actinomycetota bacterium]|nr:S8 family serine peptidase [Actinomycetota bacterium]